MVPVLNLGLRLAELGTRQTVHPQELYFLGGKSFMI